MGKINIGGHTYFGKVLSELRLCLMLSQEDKPNRLLRNDDKYINKGLKCLNELKDVMDNIQVIQHSTHQRNDYKYYKGASKEEVMKYMKSEED